MKSRNIALWILSTAVLIYFLVVAKRLLIPFVIAVAIWYLIESLSLFIGKMSLNKKAKKKIPRWLSLIFSTLVIIGLFIGAVKIVIDTFKSMRSTLPDYEDRFQSFFNQLPDFLDFGEIESVTDLFQEINIAATAGPVFDTVTNLFASVILVIIYVIFLLLERNVLSVKLKNLFGQKSNYDHFRAVLSKINESIRTYISVKIFTSFLTGFLSYLVMEIIGLDFAIFFAFLIFLLNFIPSIGSITATSLPLLFSIVQFESLSTFIILLILIVGIQIIVGNYIDPLLMGSRLNISPLVIILSLVGWGSIWGFAGMIFSVPFTAVLIIIFNEFKETKPIAILLSETGKLDVEKIGDRDSK